MTSAETSSSEVTAEADQRTTRGSVLRSVGGSALARMIALPITAVLGIVVTRLLIDNYGAVSYAQYALVVGIGALLPFADLGLGAAVMNAAAGAKDPRGNDHLRAVLISCVRLLLGSAVVVVLLAVVVQAAGGWEEILGKALAPGSGPTAATLCVAILGVNLPVAIGQRLLAGLDKYVWVVVLDALQTPLVLGVLIVMVLTGVGTGVYLAVVAYAAMLLLTLCALVLANRLTRPTLREVVRDTLRLRTVRGARVSGTAWPMLVQMVAVALAMQTDRLVLSHESTVGQLASYSLAAQMFNPVIAVVAAASTALWPVFARARAAGTRSEVSPVGIAVLFGALAAVATVLISLASPWLTELASGGAITFSTTLVVSFSVLVVVQAVKYPLGTFMTDPEGLRFQAYLIGLMLPVNFGLSWWLAPSLGAAGPVIGSIIGVTLFEVVANLTYIRRHRRPEQVGLAATS